MRSYVDADQTQNDFAAADDFLKVEKERRQPSVNDSNEFIDSLRSKNFVAWAESLGDGPNLNGKSMAEYLDRLKKALALDASSKRAKFLVARIAIHSPEFAEQAKAIHDFESVDPASILSTGSSYLGDRDIPPAVFYLEFAASKLPNDATCLNNLALSLIHISEPTRPY